MSPRYIKIMPDEVFDELSLKKRFCFLSHFSHHQLDDAIIVLIHIIIMMSESL